MPVKEEQVSALVNQAFDKDIHSQPQRLSLLKSESKTR